MDFRHALCQAFLSFSNSCRAPLPRISHILRLLLALFPSTFATHFPDSQILAGHFCQARLPHISQILRFLPSTFATHFSYSQILAKILPGTFAKHFCHAFSYSQILAKILPGTLAKHFCQALCRAIPSSVNLTTPTAMDTYMQSMNPCCFLASKEETSTTSSCECLQGRREFADA